MKTKIIVSGVGMVSPLGGNAESSWNALCAKEKPCVPTPAGVANGLSRAEEMVQSAVTEALTQAELWDGLSLQGADPERIGCIMSASKPLAKSFRAVSSGESMDPLPVAAGDDVRWISPDAINSFASARFGLLGESRNIIAACATGAYAIAMGASWIEQGLCDAVIAGSVEPYPHPLIEAGFRQMGVMSPDGITRPFDRRRKGFSFGEGAGVVVLESEASAKRRNAPFICRLSGWAMGSDSHSAVAFNSGGTRIADVIAHALKRGGLSPKDIRHVNAHGTATRLNDWIETQALLNAFGSHSKNLMISATKASTGHLLGASGSVEFVLTALALSRQFVPPTATLEEPDPECALDYTPGPGHAATMEHAVSLSFGFGGPIAALALSLP
jgi:3-oxoacyl-[acyl-carrier-protein] synthase II